MGDIIMAMLVKFAVSFVVTILLEIALSRTKLWKHCNRLIQGSIFVIIYLCSLFILFENWFIDFKTPQDIAKYTTGIPIYTVEGRRSAYVKTLEDEVYALRSKNGWKLTQDVIDFDKETKYIPNNTEYTIKLTKLKQTGEIYIFISSTVLKKEGEEIKLENKIANIEDSIGTKFHECKNSQMDYRYIGCIDQKVENYVLTIEDKEIPVDLSMNGQ